MDRKERRMSITRLLIAIVTLFAAATMPTKSSSEVASKEAQHAPFLPVVKVRFDAPLVDLSPASLQPLSEMEARLANLQAPLASSPIQVAAPLYLPFETHSFASRASAADCLTAAIYYEAATEPVVGKRAVAQVVLNRVRHPAFPNSVCEVVLQGSSRKTGCQFTFTCDGSLNRRPTEQGWQAARQIALAALSGAVEPSVGMATHYHADYVRPYWASSLDKVAAIGSHVFYRWSGSWGKRQAFTEQVALGRDFKARQAINWKLAATFLYDTDGEFQTVEPALATTQVQVATESVTPSPQSPLPSAPALQADQQHGALLADERAGELIVI